MKTILIFIFIFLLNPAAQAEWGFEPEISATYGSYKQTSTDAVTGFGVGLATGLRLPLVFLGVEGRANQYGVKPSTGDLNLNTFPIGLTARLGLPLTGLRLLASWYWDDAMYKDLQGISEYHTVYEGQGAWRAGLLWDLPSPLQIGFTYNYEQYKSFKRKKPTELTGDVVPNIFIQTVSLVVIFEL